MNISSDFEKTNFREMERPEQKSKDTGMDIVQAKGLCVYRVLSHLKYNTNDEKWTCLIFP